jgi:hypothetical protein
LLKCKQIIVNGEDNLQYNFELIKKHLWGNEINLLKGLW